MLRSWLDWALDRSCRGTQSRQDVEHHKDRGPETHSCVAVTVQEEGLAAGDTQVTAGTPTKAGETATAFL